jgi:hypothetical protein
MRLPGLPSFWGNSSVNWRFDDAVHTKFAREVVDEWGSYDRNVREGLIVPT